MPEGSKYYTLEETCAILGVSRWTVNRRVDDGYLRKFKLHGCLRFLKTEVDNLKEELYSDYIEED